MESTERLLQLFDIYWFNHDILTNKTAANPEDINDHQAGIYEEPAVTLSKLSSFYIRSSCRSDQYFLDSTHSSSFISSISAMLSFSELDRSPNSVLMTPRILQRSFFSKDQVDDRKQEEERKVKENKKGFGRRKKGGGCGRSKSLSELEFEELRGFMDLGFVFSEEDKDSSLALILPGLQRLQKKKAGAEIYSQINTGGSHYQVMSNSTSTAGGGGELQEEGNINITRPYLSEAWGWDTDNNMQEESKKEENQMFLMNNWRLPSLSNEIDMKNHLRLWAHTVASTLVS